MRYFLTNNLCKYILVNCGYYLLVVLLLMVVNSVCSTALKLCTFACLVGQLRMFYGRS